jgi:hypothetical protein
MKKMVNQNFPHPEKAHPPTEQEIEALLSSIRPQPGRHFYQKMANAPWQEQPLSFAHRALRPLAIALFVIAIAVILTFTVSSVQATARQLLKFFWPSNSDQLTLQAPFPSPGSQIESYYSLSLEQAQKAIGIPLKTIALLPDHLTFSGAHVDASLKSVALRYTDRTENLIFTQRPLGSVEEYAGIGASATVEPVQVRGVQGEFVSGAWMQTSQAPDKETSLPGTQDSLRLYWNAGVPQHFLRWQENGMAFEIIYMGEKIGKEGMIEIADSIR